MTGSCGAKSQGLNSHWEKDEKIIWNSFMEELYGRGHTYYSGDVKH